MTIGYAGCPVKETSRETLKAEQPRMRFTGRFRLPQVAVDTTLHWRLDLRVRMSNGE